MINGWEFFILNPFNIEQEKTQETYLANYNKSYNNFINEICIPNPTEILTDTKKFLHFIPCSGSQDVINNNDDYEFKFLKSTFFEKKLNNIKYHLNSYYNNYSIKVLRIYKNDTGYIIELAL
jgi:hypothetical protein